jgi:hypothetical protein
MGFDPRNFKIPVSIGTSPIDMEVHHPIGRGSLFAKVVFDAPLFFCPVWLEKSPEQVIRDLATHEKEQQTS